MKELQGLQGSFKGDFRGASRRLQGTLKETSRELQRGFKGSSSGSGEHLLKSGLKRVPLKRACGVVSTFLFMSSRRLQGSFEEKDVREGFKG